MNALTDEEREALRSLALELGLERAAKRIGVSRQAYAGLVGDLPTHRGTILAARAGLRALDDSHTDGHQDT